MMRFIIRTQGPRIIIMLPLKFGSHRSKPTLSSSDIRQAYAKEYTPKSQRQTSRSLAKTDRSPRTPHKWQYFSIPREFKHKHNINNEPLADKLQRYRQSLLEKLESHTFLFNVELINKCLKHDSYISVYNQRSHALLCAVCYKEAIEQSRAKCSGGCNYRDTTTYLLPLEKAHHFLQEDIRVMSRILDKELAAMTRIEDVLYTGFQNQTDCLAEGLEMIDIEFEQIFRKLKQQQNSMRNSLKQEYLRQKIKHENTLFQLGSIKKILEEQLRRDGTAREEEQPHFRLVKLLRHEKQLSNFRYTQADPLKEQVYSHIVLSEMRNSLRFTQSNNSQQYSVYRNHVKQFAAMLRDEIRSKWKQIVQFHDDSVP